MAIVVFFILGVIALTIGSVMVWGAFANLFHVSRTVWRYFAHALQE